MWTNIGCNLTINIVSFLVVKDMDVKMKTVLIGGAFLLVSTRLSFNRTTAVDLEWTNRLMIIVAVHQIFSDEVYHLRLFV